MANDPYYSVCCVTGRTAPQVKIEWHHNFTYRGQQVNEIWCILPVSEAIHIQARNTEMKEKLDWIMLNRAPKEVFERFDRIDLKQRLAYLKTIYG